MSIHVAPATGGRVYTIEYDALPLLDDEARRCIDGVAAWAFEHAADYGVTLEQVCVRRWQSIEDPTWIEAKVELHAGGAYANRSRFWDAAVDALVEIAGKDSRILTGEGLMLSVTPSDGG